MNRGDALNKKIKNEQGLSAYIELSHLLAPTLFETVNGQIGATLRLQGVNITTAMNSDINQYKRLLHHAITRLGEHFFVLMTTHRYPKQLTLVNHSEHSILKKISDHYHAQFQTKTHYANQWYLTVIYKGITAGKVGKGLRLIDLITRRNSRAARDLIRQSHIKKLQTAIDELKSLLAPFHPELLGENYLQGDHSELLQFLSLFFNAGKSSSLKSSTAYPQYEKARQNHTAFSKALSAFQHYPHGKLSQHLLQHQILFGQTIQFQGPLHSENKFAEMLTLKTYADQSASVMLDTLLQLDGECIITNSFAVEPKALVLKRIDRHRHKLHAVNDAATSQIDDLALLKDSVASENISMGYHHHTVMLMAESVSSLEMLIQQAIKCFADAGIVAIRETLAKKNAFFAQVPGNQKYIPRVGLISSENFVDFAPLHNEATGFYNRNHLGSALTIAETPSKSLMYINLHSTGPSDDPAKGHSAWVGGNGSGKTTALMLCAVELICRYGARIYSFDRNRGQDTFFRSVGQYQVLSPEHAREIQLNPLQLTDNKANRNFCYQWLSQLALDEQDAPLASVITERLKNCVDYGFDDLEQSHRTLTNILKILPKDFPRWPQLRRWIDEGEYAYLFDHATDTLSISPYMGFDMTHFLDKEPSQVLTAVFMYLFHRIEQTLDGSLVSIFLDEGWQYLANPYWLNKLEKWLPTLRKANCQIHLATQSATTILNNPLRDVIQNNLASLFLFANPQAKRSTYCEGLDLTEAEFQTIRELYPEDRYFLYKQENSSSICRFNLAQMTDDIPLLSSNFKNVTLADQIRKELGDDPNDWLPELMRRIKQP